MADFKRIDNTGCDAPLLEGVRLLEHLCLAFGPTGCEEEVAQKAAAQLRGCSAELYADRLGNLFALRRGGGKGYDSAAPKKMMISAHMDEVGFMVRDIDGDGYIRIAAVGGIDPRVLCGRPVIFRGRAGDVPGVIASKAIHHQTAEERKTATKIDAMYVDIGASGAEDAKAVLELGDYGTFDSAFREFGDGEKYMKCKAIDDRLGCAVMIELLRRLDEEKAVLPFDLWCCFTVREEIGKSGALAAAQRLRPDFAVVLETTAIADLPDVPENSRVASVGSGGVVSYMDRSTIYDRDVVDAVLALAREKGIAVQVKRYVSGGNDAAHIHKSGSGVKCLNISAATRYLHCASNVAAKSDYESIRELVHAVVTGYEF